MTTIQSHGVVLHVERFGQGPRLLFCNGSGTTIATTRGLLNHWAGAFELLCFDYRGMGASAPVSQAYAMADVAADVCAVLDHAGSRSAAVAGWSFGGMVAQELAVTHPERIKRLALLSTQGRLKVCPRSPWLGWQHWLWSAGLTAPNARHPLCCSRSACC
jgi:3-oxoadipate enol-lactonase